jgi:UDP-2-acetamido-3-amino-2,3-dideoxy-glucuronate N-acetyltransferase
MSQFFHHPNAIVETRNVGERTRVWAFAHILPRAMIGADCNICDNVFIENDVVLGNRVTVKCGVQLWDGIRLEDDVFVGPNATFTNDPAPHSMQHLAKYPETVVRQGASIGANATILPGITIGRHALVGAGAVVTHSVPPYAIVVGNPARIVRYTESSPTVQAEIRSTPALPSEIEIKVSGVKALYKPVVKDLRGNLTAREIGDGLPFLPKRYFVIFGVPSKEVRGEHAHRTLHQLFVCLTGSVSIVADDSVHRQEFHLDSPELALYIPPMVWAVQYRYTASAALLVMASDRYDPREYIRDYDQFLKERADFERAGRGEIMGSVRTASARPVLGAGQRSGSRRRPFAPKRRTNPR